jgi:ClpP class serine protease
MQVTRDDVVTSKLSHVASLFFGVPLAVTPDRANQIREFLVRRMRSEPSAAVDLVGEMPGGLKITMASDGIAVVDLRATLTPKDAGGIDALSGLVSHERLAAALTDLAGRADVRGVVVAMDSPGGAVMGITDSVAAMRALAAVKPVYAVADHFMASAAYWIGSQASRVFVSDGGFVGSIGSIMVRLDATAADAKAGETFTYITNMARKADGPHQAISADEIAAKLAVVTQADAMFFAGVHAARPRLAVAAMEKLNGALLMGQAAKDAGLVDELGTVSAAIAAMQAKLKTSNPDRRIPALGAGSARAEGGITMDAVTAVVEPVVAVEPAKVVPITDDPRIQAAIDAAAAQAVQGVQEVVALCASFRCPERANAFLAAKQTREQVFAVLQAEMVAKDQATATSGTHAGGEPEKPATKIDAAAYEALRMAAVLEANGRRMAPLVA